VSLVPAAGALMQQRYLVAWRLEQAATKDLSEQVVVPIPLPMVIQRKQKQVGALQRHERFASTGAAGDRVAKGTRQPVENRRLEQKRPDVRRLVGQNLVNEIVDDEFVIACEAGDETTGIVTPLE
jgi:hypothetical protein